MQMVRILRDFIRADREGNWNLHLHCLHAILPLPYSIVLITFQNISECVPDVYANFQEGKFSVKHIPGNFKAVAADMCFQQTINRSQKSTSSIIGNTLKKTFVVQ